MKRLLMLILTLFLSTVFINGTAYADENNDKAAESSEKGKEKGGNSGEPEPECD